VSDKQLGYLVVGGGILVIALIIAVFFGGPMYSVWHQRKAGEAELAKATYTRQVAIQEAHAKREAAIFLAEAEVERAKGVAAANKIIGDSLKGNEDYLRYLWISGLEHGQDQIIYIPTEAGLPILEAGRHNVQRKKVEND